MDYHSMKRRELQALCKEHNIPASSSNSILADQLSELVNKKQKPTSRTCMKSAVESTDLPRREAKKVRFSPTNDLFEYELLRSGKKDKDTVTETKNRRMKNKEIMEAPVRVTRSRGQTKVSDSDVSNNLSSVASENNQEVARRKSSRTSGVEIATKDGSERLGHGKRKKTSEESSTTADKESRQSRRNRAKVEDSTVLNPSVGKVEMVVEKKVTRSKALLKSSQGFT